jgi:hypothetical protein
MVKVMYCWRFQILVPMLEKRGAADMLKDGRDQPRSLRRYLELTGFE